MLPPLTTLTQQVAAVVLFPFVKNNRVSRGTPPPQGSAPDPAHPSTTTGRSRADGAASSGQDPAPRQDRAKAITVAGSRATGREDSGASRGTGSVAGVSALASRTERRPQLNAHRIRCWHAHAWEHRAISSTVPCSSNRHSARAHGQLAGDFHRRQLVEGLFSFFFFPFFRFFFNKNGL